MLHRSEYQPIRQGLACVSFSGQKEHGGYEWKMRLYQTEQKLEVGAKATNSEHCCKLTIITSDCFTL